MELIYCTSLTKRPGLYKRIGNAIHPVIYFQKAKNASDEEFNEIMEFLINKAKTNE